MRVRFALRAVVLIAALTMLTISVFEQHWHDVNYAVGLFGWLVFTAPALERDMVAWRDARIARRRSALPR